MNGAPACGPRVSRIGFLYANTVSQASTLQCGDNGGTDLHSRAIAVQRAVTDFVKDETRFASYPLFVRPKLSLQTEATADFEAVDCCPHIDVGCVYVLGVSASSLLRVGTTGSMQAETRILHIRQYNNVRDIR